MGWSYLYCKNMNDSLFTRGFWVIIIRLCRRDGRVVQGVALELLCRLLFTEGSNPSLSVPSPNSPTLPTAMNQIPIDTIIPTKPFFFPTKFYLSLPASSPSFFTGRTVRLASAYSVCYPFHREWGFPTVMERSAECVKECASLNPVSCWRKESRYKQLHISELPLTTLFRRYS